jgi:hypothetical protein
MEHEEQAMEVFTNAFASAIKIPVLKHFIQMINNKDLDKTYYKFAFDL